jgi:cytochrome b
MDAPHQPAAATADADRLVRVWDLPTRLFHWILAVLVAGNLVTGSVGGLWQMELHMTCGYAVLALVLFRLIWGVVGSRHSRFGAFVRGPAAVLAYARDLVGGRSAPAVGHNPMGGWSVMAMLAVLLVQAGTGLFARDDILTEGPLARTVSKATSSALTAVHEVSANLLMLLIAVHLAAVFAYLLRKGENLIRPMITGVKRWPAGGGLAADAPFASSWAALAAAVAAAALVWVVVA